MARLVVLPLYKAEKQKVRGEEVLGYPFQSSDDKIYIITKDNAMEKTMCYIEIVESTLEVSFDNGFDWEKVVDVSELINDNGVDSLRGAVEFSESYS
jgi:hypothetical protein